MRIHYLSLVLCAVAPAVGCRRTEAPDSANFGRFEGEVVASWNDDGRHMTLREDFRYVDSQDRTWIAPAGSVVDGASIPAAFWSFIGGPFEGRYRNASVVHDVECVDMTSPWEDVHRMFYEACRCGGVDETKAKIMYYAVYHFGPRWQPVTETRVEMRPDATGQIVEQEVTEQRIVRIDPPPPTPEEVEQVEALIEEENPELSVIEKSDREVLRRRPRRGSGRPGGDDGPRRPSSPEEVDRTARQRPDRIADRSKNGESRPDDGEPKGRAGSGEERTRADNGHGRRDGPRSRRPGEQDHGTALPAVTPEEQQWAVEQVRHHIEQQSGQPRPADYEVERTRDGFRVFVEYRQLDDDGQPIGEPVGTSTVRLSRDGQVMEMISGR